MPRQFQGFRPRHFQQLGKIAVTWIKHARVVCTRIDVGRFNITRRKSTPIRRAICG
jgi:hypothetical protein